MITSKIHCAMPCIAMGIPVVFIYDAAKKNDYRVSIVQDLIGINYVGETLLDRLVLNRALAKMIDWSPAPIDFEVEKSEIRTKYLVALGRAIENFQSRYSSGDQGCREAL